MSCGVRYSTGGAESRRKGCSHLQLTVTLKITEECSHIQKCVAYFNSSKKQRALYQIWTESEFEKKLIGDKKTQTKKNSKRQRTYPNQTEELHY